MRCPISPSLFPQPQSKRLLCPTLAFAEIATCVSDFSDAFREDQEWAHEHHTHETDHNNSLLTNSGGFWTSRRTQLQWPNITHRSFSLAAVSLLWRLTTGKMVAWTLVLTAVRSTDFLCTAIGQSDPTHEKPLMPQLSLPISDQRFLYYHKSNFP